MWCVVKKAIALLILLFRAIALYFTKTDREYGIAGKQIIVNEEN